MRQAQSDAFAAAQQLTRVRNEITALDLQKQGNVVRLEKLSAEKIQLEEERDRLEARLAGVSADVEAEKLNARRRVARSRSGSSDSREIQRAAGARRPAAGSGRCGSRPETRSRLNVLEQLQADHEGSARGTLAAS